MFTQESTQQVFSTALATHSVQIRAYQEVNIRGGGIYYFSFLYFFFCLFDTDEMKFGKVQPADRLGF